MEVTVIVPFSEGLVDLDGYISAGIEVFEGHLTVEQLDSMLREPAYEQVARFCLYDHAGKLLGVEYTYSNTADQSPTDATGSDAKYRYTGARFEQSEAGTGHLSYQVEFKTTDVYLDKQAPAIS